MSKSKKIAILAIVAMVLMMLPVQLFAADTTDRISGADRIGTAIAIADAGWTSANTVILAPSANANLVDALAAAPLAGQENAPILLTDSAALNASVKAKIAALGAKKVILVGALSDGVKSEVAAISGVTVEVLKGASRWETASLINAKISSPAGTFVVGYNAIPDALSAASFAAKNKYQIVLADVNGAIPAGQSAAGTVYILGGPTLVKDITGATRIYGADRFATNKAVAEKLTYSFAKVYVANGISCVDALSVAPLAAQDSAFVALASATDVAAASVVNDKLAADFKVIAVGGTGAVSDAVKSKIGLSVTNPVTCAVTAKNYDDDTKDQYVAFTVNGQSTTVEALNALGWDLEFTAGPSKADVTSDTATVFADTTTGLLNDSIAPLDYYIQLTLTKGSDVVISAAQKVTVKNLNLVATGISDYTLSNDANGGTAFEMNSTKLVVGETATFEDITVTNGSDKEDITFTGDEYSLKTSDAGVISKTSNTITAQTPGSATITITYGNATKAISFTVVSDDREADKLQVKKASDGSVVTSLKIFANTGIVVKALDQYGDPMEGAVLDATVANYNILDVATETIVAGDMTLTIATPKVAGTTTITFTESGVKVGTFTVTVSTDADATKKTLELYKVDTDEKLDEMNTDLALVLEKGDFSTDTTIDISDDSYLVYQVKKTNADGVSLGNETLTYGTPVLSKAGVLDDVNSGVYNNRVVIVAGTKEGTATVKFTDSDGKLYTVKVTVVNQGYTIKSISLKTPTTSDYGKTYNYKSVLNYASTGNDPIITGITLEKAASQAIRLDLAGNTGNLYLDKDSNGLYGGDDEIVGSIVISATGTIAGATPPAAITDANLSYVTQASDDGTIIFKIFNAAGDIVASKSVTVEL